MTLPREPQPIVIGNWKMELSYKAAVETAAAIKKSLKSVPATVSVVVCPSFPALSDVARELGTTKRIEIGAQDIHWEERGPMTGEVSVLQFGPAVRWCIVGHSERRQLWGETDEQVAAKVSLLLKHSITPVVCVGESKQQRDAGQTVSWVTEQVTAIFSVVSQPLASRLVVAYEPIWAIGTGEAADPDDAAEVMLLIRKLAAERFGQETATRMRIIYGGSVSDKNAQELADEPGIDGVLVGGASLRPLQFAAIVKAFER